MKNQVLKYLQKNKHQIGKELKEYEKIKASACIVSMFFFFWAKQNKLNYARLELIFKRRLWQCTYVS